MFYADNVPNHHCLVSFQFIVTKFNTQTKRIIFFKIKKCKRSDENGVAVGGQKINK